jgi:hypothetical protein
MDNKNKFNETGYCLVKNAINEELRDFVTQYALFDEMQDFSPEGIGRQVQNAHSKYADPAMEVMLLHLHKTMQENTGLELFPTYSYYRVYRSGDDLKIHKDRDSCEISCTLCFNYNYENLEYQWPIVMNGNEITLFPGDMIIYRGCDLEHYRDTFIGTENDWHVQGFFHYVDVNGPKANCKYDFRNSIGEKKMNVNNNSLSKSYIQYV